METKVTSSNQEEFYRVLYNTDRDPIDIGEFPADQYIIIDSNGMGYRKKYLDKNITLLVTITTAKQFKLTQKSFDKLIDNQIHNKINWPQLSTKDSVVIIDYSPLFKYLTISEINEALENMSVCYQPKKILFNANLAFIDDDRNADRFNNISKLSIAGYVVERFTYDSIVGRLRIDWKSKVQL